jgi:hypothetical protein
MKLAGFEPPAGFDNTILTDNPEVRDDIEESGLNTRISTSNLLFQH